MVTWSGRPIVVPLMVAVVAIAAVVVAVVTWSWCPIVVPLIVAAVVVAGWS